MAANERANRTCEARAVAAELDSDGTRYTYLWGPGRIPLSVTARTAAGVTTTYAYHTDALGSVLAMTDAAGSIVATYTYDPWGRVTSATNSEIAARNPLRYRSYYLDAETGLYYMPARYYDPATARFLSVDPAAPSAGDPSSLNAFAYCLDDPVNATDPSGAIADIYREHPDGVTVGMAIKRQHEYLAKYRKGFWPYYRSWVCAQRDVKAARLKGEVVIRPSMTFTQRKGWAKPANYDYWQEDYLRSNGLWRFTDQPGKASLKLSAASDSDLAADTLSYASGSVGAGIEAGAASTGGLVAAGAGATIGAFVFIDAAAWISAWSNGTAIGDYFWGDASLGDALWSFCGGALLDEMPMISDMMRHK